MRTSTQTNKALEAVETFADFWHQSLAAEGNKDYPKAIVLTEEFQKAKGDPFLAEMRKGWLYSLAGNPNASLKAYSNAVKSNYRSVNARKGVLVAQTALGNKSGMANAAFKVIEVDPANYLARMTVANAYFQNGDWKNAATHLAQIANRYPMDVDTLAMSTLALIKINQKASALEMGGRLATLLPGYATASETGKQIHAAIGAELDKLKTARNQWQKSIEAETAKNYSAALKANTAFVQAGGDRYLGTIRAAWIYRLGEKPDEALKFYQHAALMKPAAITPRQAIYDIQQTLGNNTNITNAVRDLIKVDPANYTVAKAEGAKLFADKNYRKAAPVFDKLLQAYPMDTELLSYYGWSKYYLNKARDMKAPFINLYTLDPSYADVKNGLRLSLGLPLYEFF